MVRHRVAAEGGWSRIFVEKAALRLRVGLINIFNASVNANATGMQGARIETDCKRPQQ